MFCNIYKTSLHCFPLRLAVRKASTKSRKTYKSHDIKLNEYLDEINATYLKNFLPPKLLQFAKVSEQLYLIDENVAGHISETIGKNLRRSSLVVETNPGLGILTKRLLDNGVHCINLYESNPHFFPHLCTLKNNYEENIMLFKNNLLEIMKLKFQDRMDSGSREEEVIQTLPNRRWAEDPPVPIIATLTSTYFIRYLLMSLFMQNGLMICCRPDLYLIVPQMILNVLVSKTSKYYRTLSLLFHMVFKVTLLTKVPREAFLPWMQNSKGTSAKGEDQNFKEMYLIQATARPDFYETVVSPEKMQELWYFISVCFVSPKAFVIPSLEKYIPNSGTRLIFRNDFNIYTRFSDLSLEQILSLFRQFVSWPEYSISVFNSCVHTAFMKSNISFEEVERHLNRKHDENEGEKHKSVIKGAQVVNY